MGKNEIYKWMKRSLKNKVSITGKMLVIFLISGTLSQAGAVAGAALANGQATPSAENSLAIGNESKASVKEAYAIGTGAKSNSISAFAFGYHSEIGQNSDFAYVLGGNSKVGSRSKHSYAIGHYSEVDDDTENAYGIGWNAKVKKGATSSYAIGDHAETYSKKAYALGKESKVDENSEEGFAMGNFAKVEKNAGHSYAIGSHSKVGQGAEKAYAIGDESQALKRESYAIGNKSETNAENSYAFGNEAKVNQDSNFGYAIGHRSEVERGSKYSYAIGYEARVGAGLENVYAIGREAKAMATNSLVFGSNTTVAKSATDTIALGSNINGATESNSVYLGNGSTHGKKDETTIGKGSYANTNINGVTFNGYAGMNAYGVVTVGSKGQERRIQNVAAGWIDPKSTDAVNGSQLHAVAKTLLDKLGDVVEYDKWSNREKVTLKGANGTKITNLKEGDVNATSKDAINGSQLHKVEQKINNIVKYDSNDKKKVTLEGAGGTTIDKVKDGTLAQNSQEAVNGSQLYKVDQKVNKNTTDITNLTTKVTNNTNNITKIQDELKDVVKYDKNTNKGKVTLQGGNNGTIITNLKKGAVNPTSTDAINGSQLHEVNQKVEKNKTDITNLTTKVNKNETNITNIQNELKNVVKYDNASHDTITLKTGGTTIKNVKAATQNDEAVNYGQLKKTEQNLTDKGLTFAANKGADKKVKLGEKVEIKGSDNLNEANASDKNVMTSISGNKITVKIATKPKFDEVEAGTGANKVVIGENKIELGGKKYITNTGINANNQKIINVETPTQDKDAANKKYVDDKIKDVSGSFSGTLTYEADSGKKTMNLKNDVLKLKGDKNIKTEVDNDGKVKFSLKDILSLNRLTIDGTNGHITGLANTTWNKNSVVADRAASEGQLKQVEEGLDKKITQNKTDITNIKNELDNVVKYDQGSNKGKVTLQGNGGTTITNVKDGKIEAGSKDAVNGGQIHDIKKDITNKIENVNNKVENNTKNIQNIQKELENVVKYDQGSNKGKITLEGKNGGTTITNVKDGKVEKNSKDAVNGGQLHDVEQKIKDVDNKIKDQGLTFKGNDGQHKAKLGSEFNIKGSDSLTDADVDSKNIRTSVNGNTLQMQFAKRPEFEKVTAGSGENKVEIGNDGVKVGGQAYITKEGLNANGKKITNVADGTADSDAVNYGQLKKMMQNNGNVDEKIKTLDSKLSGAVAQAMAMANIPQVGDNKLFSIGVGGAYYNKQGGFAVGISGTEPSNTFIYKISAGVDTKKQWSIGAGFNLNFGTNKKANINNECCDLSNEKVKRLENENKNMKEQINDLKDLVKQLMNKIDQKPQIVEVEKVVEKVVEVPKVIEKKILVACFSTEKKCVIHGFAVDGRVPSKEEQKQLRDVASKINAFAESGTMSIVGHTDSDGSHAYNDKLSLQRATTVSRLLKEAGLSEALTVKEITGKGKREPMATNSTRVGKYLNRRVELLFDDIVIK